jgi:hypothetical protein
MIGSNTANVANRYTIRGRAAERGQRRKKRKSGRRNARLTQRDPGVREERLLGLVVVRLFGFRRERHAHLVAPAFSAEATLVFAELTFHTIRRAVDRVEEVLVLVGSDEIGATGGVNRYLRPEVGSLFGQGE